MVAPQRRVAKALYEDREHEIKDVCRPLHISRSTLYRYLVLPDGEATVPEGAREGSSSDMISMSKTLADKRRTERRHY